MELVGEAQVVNQSRHTSYQGGDHVLVRAGEPAPPLSAFPKEKQEIVMRILVEGAKRKIAREAREAQQQQSSSGN